MKKILLSLFSIFLLIGTHMRLQAQSQGQTPVDSLSKILSKASADSNKVDILNKLAIAIMGADPKKAKEYSLESENLAKKLDFKKGEATALQIGGSLAAKKGDFVTGIEYQFRSMAINEKIGSRKGVTVCLNNLGNYYYQQGNYTKALENHFKALREREIMKDEIGILSSLNNIGTTYEIQKDVKKALEYYERGLILAKKLKNKEREAAIMFNMAGIMSDKQQYKEALAYNLKVVAIREEIEDFQVSDAYRAAGEGYVNAQDYTKADEYFQKAIKSATENEDLQTLAVVNSSLGDMYEEQKLHAKSIEFHLKGYEIAKKIGAKDIMKNALADLKDNYAHTGDYTKAYKVGEEFLALKDSLFNEDKSKEIGKLDTEIEDIKSNKIFENAFEWRFEFPEVLNDEGDFVGFDVIIGNPPYIQLQSMKEISEQLKQFEYLTYEKTGDIYSLFYEKGNTILKNGGYLSYITSNKWMRAGYGKTTRNYFLENTQPELLVDLGSGVFEEATVDANILIFKKEINQKPFHAFDISKEKNVTHLQDFHHKMLTISPQINESWTISNELEQNIKTKIERLGKPLKDWDINIYRGILTGYNEAFIIDGKKKDELIAQDPKSAEIIKPILRGRDIKRYKAEFADLWLINAHNGELVKIKKTKHVDFIKIRIFRNKVWEKVNNLELTKYSSKYRINRIDVERDYPTVYNYLQQFEDQLTKRQDKGDHWTNLRNCAYLQEFEKEKIVYNDICQKLTFSKVAENIFFNNTAYFIIVDKKLMNLLLCILNSKIIDWYYRTLSVQLGEKAVRMFSIYVEKIPVVFLSEEAQKPFIFLVEQILAKKEQNEDTSALEAEIDVLVYAFYALTEEEIKIIEKK